MTKKEIKLTKALEEALKALEEISSTSYTKCAQIASGPIYNIRRALED